MQVNYKKSYRIKNRTKYFNPNTTRTYVHFSSPDSYQNRQIKIEGYETRLYWQYRYCDEHNGQTFFYTLTYNDAHMPNHYGMNCFDYEDLRNLLCGGFRKMLLRKYGTYFKYFVGAELGDGKGERGMHNNPHYHILFFLEDAKDTRFPYIKISPEDFRYLVKRYWQGFDENRDGYHDYNDALYGIAREGENCGLVTDFRACMYCAKYVCKDVKLKQNESKIERLLRFQNHKKYYRSEVTYALYFKDRIRDMYNIPRNAKKTEWTWTDEELVKRLLPDYPINIEYECFGDDIFNIKRAPMSYTPYVPVILNRYNLWEDYFKFCRAYVDERVHEGITEWRNRYCNKCRISQGLGDYALSHIQDKMNPGIQVPKKKGFKVRPIGMYYYRKLYTEIVMDNRGNKVRVLNDLGQEYKVYNLPKQIDKMAKKAESQLNVVINNEELYMKMRQSDVNIEVFYSFSALQREINKLKETDNIKNICKRYAEFKLVYEDRFFKMDLCGLDNSLCFPKLDVISDFRRFTVPAVYSTRYSDFALSNFLEDNGKDYVPYWEHPDFLCYHSIFLILDLCADYFFIQGDNQSQKQAEELAEVRRFHNRIKVQEFYQKFQN